MTWLEVYNPNEPDPTKRWLRIMEAKAGQKAQKKGEQVILNWEHEGKKIQTVFNLSNFAAYCIG